MEIPLFPLPGLVLFPNIILPLHIFEERYKQMVNLCIENDHGFGLLLLREGAQEETEKTIHRVGTLARVVEVQRLDGGRMNIFCRAETRFRVSRFIQTEAYWMGDVRIFEDDPAVEEQLAPLAMEVSSLYSKAFNLGVKLNIVAASELKLPESAMDLSFMVSYVLDIEAEEKQKLLEMKSTEDRLRSLMVFVDDTVRKLEQQLVHRELAKKARRNGDLGR